jgi:hypothetical protein
MKRGSLKKICLCETYSRDWVGKNLFVVFSIGNGLKKEDGSSPLLPSFPLDYAFMKVQFKHDGLKLDCRHQYSVYVDDNILVGRLQTIKRNTNLY